MRSISIIHPSRGRSEQAINTAQKWLQNSDNNFQYILALDCDNYANYPSFYAELNNAGKMYISIQRTNTAIEAINKAVELATGDIFVIISDDFDCPEHWDTLLLEVIGDKTDFCAKTLDGHQDWLITLPIMDRIYYDRFGFVYHPDYVHCYADTEMTCVAWMLDKYISLPIEFKHLHPAATGAPMDATYIRNNQSWSQGKQVFRDHAEKGFGIEAVKPYPRELLQKQKV